MSVFIQLGYVCGALKIGVYRINVAGALRFTDDMVKGRTRD